MKLTKIFTCIFFSLIIISCNKKETSENETSNKYEFKDYITNVSSGIISKNDDVRLVLVNPVKEWTNNLELEDSYFSISPKVKGKWVALNNRTISFKPENGFKENTEYVFNVSLDKFQKTTDDLANFSFKIKTIKQDFIVTTNTIQSYSRDWQYLVGNIKTSDILNLKDAKKIISASQNNKSLNIKFDAVNNESNFFTFTIDSIKRNEENSEIQISYDGTQIDVDQKNSFPFTIIGKNNFKVTDITVNSNDKQYLEINFSDPLQKNQNFKGLIEIKGTKKLDYVVNGNVLKVFTNTLLKGTVLVEIFQGITSTEGYKLKAIFKENIAFEQPKPEIKLLQNGTILPNSENLKFNFESINLKAAEVTVYKIFEDNILQFLQNNNLNGNNSLKQVSRPIARKTINLEKKSVTSLSKWNSFSVDLKSIINNDPGAIYRVELSFLKKHALYKCDNDSETKLGVEEIDYDNEDLEDSNWDYNGYYNNYDYNYNWRERNNPCDHSYYRNKKISANVLASNLGVTIKKGNNKSYFVAVTDLLTTEPVSNATVSFYNYQQQEIASKKTDETGKTYYDAEKPAFFALVSKNKQTTYVKLNDGNALSMSKYDVSGVRLKKGLKGFIYGERGVWRPGDTLFLSFMLNDNANKLPEGHPVKFELKNPQGTITHREIKTEGLNNFYRFSIPTNANDITGNWTAKINVGGAQFSKKIKIETIKPNRLKIKAGFDTEIITSSKPIDASIEALWLHGAIAKNLKADVNVRFNQKITKFENFSSYVFHDPARRFNTEEQVVFDGKVNEQGKAIFNFKPTLKSKSPGMLKASFITKVYENGGDFSTDVFTKTYSPYTSYVGLSTPKGDRARNMLLTDTEHRFDVATVDEKGNPIAVKDLEVKIYKVTNSWWWNATSNNLSQYDGSTYKKTVFTKTIATKTNGKTSFNFKLKYPDWGRFLVRIVNKKSGHATGQTIFVDWPGWAGKARKGNPKEATMLIFKSDKNNYNVGETANVTFPSGGDGTALITIENGTEVLESRWVKTTKGDTKFDFKITPEMTPNVYINIASFQKHANTANDLPIRTYGVTGISVENPTTRLYPEITMPKVLEPEEKIKVKVNEKNGAPMTYSIAIVDEGLLDLTRYKTPNPWDSFYAKEALGVKTWDIYDDVLGAYGGRINQVFSIGGDGMAAGSKNKKANRFKPVVVYLGPFEIGKNQSKTHDIKIPKYIGSVRTMVVAHNPEIAAYGSIEKTTPVRKPLMVLASLPRKVTPGEKVRLPITVFAMEKKIKNVNITLKQNNTFKVLGNSSQNISFNQPDEKMVYFDIEVLKNGIGTLEITASGNGEKASYNLEVDALNPNPETTEVKDIILTPNSSQTINFETFGVQGTNSASIELSSLPAMDFNSRLQYLIKYPHGCVEQTTSSVFPQLFMNDIFDLSFKKKKQIQDNIQIGIDRLAHFQTTSGGFSYWRGGRTVNDWSTSYAGHFLIEAEKKGFVLPIAFKNKWLRYQKDMAKKWRYNAGSYRNGLAQAYRLYTLALANNADLSSMNRLRETKNITPEAKYRLAAAYAIIGQKSAAENIINKTPLEFKPTKYNYYTYGSTERNKAMALETYILLKKTSKTKNLGETIALSLSNKSKYMSTQTTAYSLLAMSKYAQFLGGKGVDISFTTNGKNNTNIKTDKVLASRNVIITSGANSIALKNNKENTIYARLVNKGVLPVGEEKIAQRNLTATVVYKTKNGKLLDVTKVNQGTDFIAEVTISNSKNERVKDVALSVIFPSGWEIVNTRFTDFGSFKNNAVDHEDIRDDRSNFYFDLNKRETKTVRVLLNASYLGNYYLSGVQCEAMYDDDYFVRTKGQWIEVVK